MKRWELRCTLAVSPLNDLAVVARERIPVDDTGEIISTGIGYAPEWMIEILQTRADEGDAQDFA